MKQSIIVNILYANEAHSEVSTPMYFNLVEPGGGIDIAIDAIISSRVPVVWSTQGIDLDMLSAVNPACLERMRQNIGFLDGIYTHVLPSFHPEYLDKQLCFGKDAFSRHGITPPPVGMLPEFDVYPGILPLLANHGWKNILLQDSLNPLYEYRHDMSTVKTNASLVRIADESGDSRIIGIKATSEPRGTFLKMLRGYATPEEMIDALASSARKAYAVGCPVVPFLIDFESVEINSAREIFSEYLSLLGKANGNEIRLGGFDSDTLAVLDGFSKSKEIPYVKLSTRAKPKWIVGLDTDGIMDKLKGIDIQGKPQYYQKAFLWACVSDYYSTQFNFRKSPDGIVARLPSKNKKGEETLNSVIIGGDRRRLEEISHVAIAVEKEILLTENSGVLLSEESKRRMKILHQALGC